jgi:pantoate--beta-alanine ligase
MTVEPVLASTRGELQLALSGLAAGRAETLGARAESRPQVALVPTMGALHAGHGALLARARREVGPDAPVVVSVFVNPLQFAPGEDLDRYPRTLDADLEICAEHGVDVVFAPSVDEVYPGGDPQVTVSPGPLAEVLEGASRPTHFAGVLTVVAKLFGLVRPDVAVFGEKDYQQLALIRRMVADLCMGLEVVGGETAREPDGLALSSRNRYLGVEDRANALALARALFAARSATGDARAALAAARAELEDAPGIAVDYLELTAPDLGPAPASGPARLLVAARVGSTRLIDNVALELASKESR